MPVSEVIAKKLTSVSVDVKVKKDKILLAATDSCVYVLSFNGNEIDKKCFDVPLKSVDEFDEVMYVVGRDNMLRIVKGNDVKKVRVGFSVTRVFAFEEGTLVCGDKCAMFRGEEKVWDVDVGQVIGKVRLDGDKIYAPDNVLKRVHVINLNGEIVRSINVNEKAFDLDVTEDRLYVGTTKRVIAMTKDGNVLWSVEPGWFNFVCVAQGNVFVAVRNSKKIMVFTEGGEKVEEFGVDGKPAMLDCTDGVVVSANGDSVAILKLLEEEVEEVKEKKEEKAAMSFQVSVAQKEEVEVKEKRGLLKELEEISEGDYMGSPLAKELIKEVESALESLEVKQENLNEAIDVLLKEIDELMNIGGADWKSVLERYEKAYEKVLIALNLIENAKKLVGEVKQCPPIEEILKGLREKSAAKFINFLISLSEKEGSPAEKAKEGAEKVKLCVLKEVLKVDEDKVKKLMEKKEKLEADIAALKALLGEA